MKKVFLLLCIAITLASCGTLVNTPLKGTYVDKPIEITTNKPYEKVWSNIIDLFATKGLSIKLIDKSSGLIVSEKTSLINNYSFEDAKGNLINPSAYIALDRNEFSGLSSIIPERITAEWNIRIKAISDNQTVINVNLTNIDATKTFPASQYSAGSIIIFKGKSTGNFEKEISDIVK
jgi:hypothetical protein